MSRWRVAEPLATLGLAMIAAFLAVRALPGDPAAASLFRHGAVVTPEAIAALRAEHGLDAPAWRQFAAWAAGLVTGDWGRSLRNGEPILHGLAARLPVSLAIGAGGLALGAATAYLLALQAAAGSRAAEFATRLLADVAQALPAFVGGMILLYVFGVELRWIRPFTGGPVERVLLPTAVVALYACGRLARLVAGRLRDAMQRPWFTTALAKGLSRAQAIRRHAGGFGLIALVAALRPEAAWVVGGTAVTEVLFGAPGISAWVVESIGHRDYAVLQAYILAVAVWMAVVQELSGLAMTRLDPRLRT